MKKLFDGTIKKMGFINLGDEKLIKPKYILAASGNDLYLNDYIGKRLNIRYKGIITCLNCGKETKKSFGQGYCYPCFISIPQTEECVLRPELCRAHEGIARDMEYAKENCLVDQIVYLALSGGLKVGVTRYHQIPNRWVDQGATKAIKLAIAKDRYTAGLIEVTLKKILADKTNWRKMLTGNDEDTPLTREKGLALDYLKQFDIEYKSVDDSEYRIQYPINEFPNKVISKDLEKESMISGVLMGIKGQYLLFEGGMVINIRKHSGYHIEMLEV